MAQKEQIENDISNTARERINAIVQKFSLLALLSCLAIANVVANIKLPYPIVDRMLKNDLSNEAFVWRNRVMQQLEGGADVFVKNTQASENGSAAFDSNYLNSQDIYFLEHIPQASEIYRFKMFDQTGRVFWSSRPSDIGSVKNSSYFTDFVMNGELYYAHETKPSSEVDGFDLRSFRDTLSLNREVAEVYTPILQDGSVVGAIEFYTDITETRETFAARVKWLMMAISAISMVLLFAVALTVQRGNRQRLAWLQKKTTLERRDLEKQMQLAHEVSMLGELNEWLQSSRSLDELFDMVARFMTHLLPDCEGSVYVFSNSRDVLDGAAAWNGGSVRDHIHPEQCWGLRRGRTYVYGTSSIDFVCEHTEPHDERPYFCFPILAHGETIGLMHLKSTAMVEADLFKKNQKLAQMCAEQISLAIANVQMRDQLQERSVRDPLTGLFNRRHMTDYLRKMIQNAERAETFFSIIYLDVDHFKKFNDNHGHDAGDIVLRTVGEALERSVDRHEIACRMGGEEFMLLLPATDQQGAAERAESLRKTVESIALRYNDKILPPITISAGIAQYPDHGLMPQDLLRVADNALYQAKANGRNNVVVAEQLSPSTPMDGEDLADKDFEEISRGASRAKTV